MTETTPKYALLGSCFAQNVGEKLRVEGYDTLVNPLGTLYNPESIRLTITTPPLDTDTDLVFYDPTMHEWRSWIANTRVRHTDRQTLIDQINTKLHELSQHLSHTTHSIITLGTNVCYQLTDSGITVTNCQRQPSRHFREHRMSQQECVESLEAALHHLWTYNPQMHITLTVSPYRYLKYGLHASQLSKATLLLAVDQVISLHPQHLSYFPSYEIMIDELRDYRYYTADTLHPTPEAIDIIWERYKTQITQPCK